MRKRLAAAGIGFCLAVAAGVVGCETNGAGAPSTIERGRSYPQSPAEVRRAPDATPRVREAREPANREGYDDVDANGFVRPELRPLSTFALDVDTASYANVRRLVDARSRVPAGAVRVEDFVNYFDYAYDDPDGDAAMAVRADLTTCPWEPDHHLMRVAVKARELDELERPEANLVFLVDVSGSMNSPDKLPLVQLALRRLLDALRPEDRVAMVVYAGTSGVALPSTEAVDRDRIERAIDDLSAGGSTNGAAGIADAYAIARDYFVDGGINRVVLCTDGDFNVGVSDRSGLVELVQQEAKSGVYLTVLGFGTGNLQDAQMEALSNRGNGNYAYVDSADEARRVLGRRALSTLATVARDAKIQVEFNPRQVAAYRLIGYENRLMDEEEFRDDTADAGEVGAGHEVTAFYEIVPADRPVPDEGEAAQLRYQRPAEATPAGEAGEVAVVRLRYQPPGDLDAPATRATAFARASDLRPFDEADDDLRFAAAAAAFAMALRDEPQFAAGLGEVEQIAESAVGRDPFGDRREMLDLLRGARRLR